MFLAQLFLDAAIAHDDDIALDPAKLATARRAVDGPRVSRDPLTSAR